VSAPLETVHDPYPAAAPDADFLQPFVDGGLIQTSLDHIEVGFSGQHPGNAPEIPEHSMSLGRREVIMTISEYEERFRSPTPSLHQTFAATRGHNRGRLRTRRLGVAAALVGVMAMTCKIASLHTVHNATSDASQIWKSGRLVETQRTFETDLRRCDTDE
jgi:hypothetical protein